MDIKYDEKKWNASNTRMLLTLYSERQADFRNPKRKIKDVWGEMVVALQSQGMTDIDATQLDRKFRNLKKTYYCIKSKHLAKGPQYHPNWQFYDDMTELLKDEPVPWTQVLTMDDYSAMHTFLRDDEAYNPVNEMESGRMLSIGTTVRTVVPRPQKRPYRKRKLAMGETDAKFGGENKEPRQPTREADPVTVFNAAEPEPSILAESKDELSIATKEDALRHLRALQEYAMFQDNFRAIGLLMQAENAIQYPPKSDDFEVDQK